MKKVIKPGGCNSARHAEPPGLLMQPGTGHKTHY